MTSDIGRGRGWTYIGLSVALLGIPAVVLGYRLIVGETTAAVQLGLRELAIFALVATLLWIVRYGERLPLSSIGLRRENLGRSLLWGLFGLLLLAVTTGVALGTLKLLGMSYGSGKASFVAPAWATLLIVLRAGIAEEVFYRGFAIERLEALTGSKIFAAVVPLIAFAAFHYRQGWAGVLVALILGAVLTAFYMWKRNLVANIVAHFLIDFIPNLLLPLVFSD